MTHLSQDEFIDAAEGSLEPVRQAHLDHCSRCRQEVSQLEALLRATEAVDVPEPSPLFWDRFSRQVRTAIDAEPANHAGSWFRWAVLTPLAALALLVFALASALPLGSRTSTARVASGDGGVVDTTLAALDDDWAAVSELLGDIDLDTAREAGIALERGSADDVVQHLSSAEQEELIRLLQAELQRPGG